MKADADRLVILSQPRSPAAEAYRTLRTNIRLSSLDSPVRTLLVTSAAPGEGKTTTLSNLAVAMAQGGTRVAIADCDLRQPSIHQLFDLANDKGLTTALLDDNGAELPLQQTAIPNLQVLTSGPTPPNPTDLLGSPRMQRVIDALATSAELVLFNAPPVVYVSDAILLASRMDGVILVVSAGKTRRDAASRARAVLEKANARILGAVLSNVRLDPSLYRYYESRR